jgi:hypothetical protein
MIQLTKFQKFFPTGTSQCFLGMCSDNKEWVIRLRKTGKNAKRLFSQFVASNLAELIGISCPNSSIINVNFNLLTPLPSKYDEFDIESEIGAGSLFIRELTHFPRPKDYNDVINTPQFEEINLKHLNDSISSKEQFDQLYGMRVFTDWINMSDYHKYENLCLQSENSIIFLDFDLAFSSNNGSWEVPDRYDFITMVSHQAPFWEGIFKNIDIYDPWMQNILNISKDDIESIFSQIPNCWDIPKQYIKLLTDFLLNNREQFILEFLNALDYRENVKAIEKMNL